MNGAVLAIAVASVALLVVPGLVLGGLAHFALRGTRWAGVGRSLGGACGAGLGFLAMIAAFYDTRWDPPVEITFEVPPGYAHETIILLEDPAAADIPWSGLWAQRARLVVPRGGVVRVRSLAVLREHDRVGFLSTGERDLGLSVMPAPDGLGASTLLAFDFGTSSHERELSSLAPAALAIVVRAREAE